MWERAQSASAAIQQTTGMWAQALLLQPGCCGTRLLHKGYHTASQQSHLGCGKNTSQNQAWLGREKAVSHVSSHHSLAQPLGLPIMQGQDWPSFCTVPQERFLRGTRVSCWLQLLPPQGSSFPMSDQGPELGPMHKIAGCMVTYGHT